MGERATLLTGASAGIGAAILERLLAEGRTVVTLQRRPPAQANPKVHFIAADLTDAESTRRAAAEAASRFEIEALVHNAGGGDPEALERITLEVFHEVVSLHMQAAILLAQAVVPGMKARRFGRIVHIGSRAMLGKKGRSTYGATKAAMVGLARTWALELGPHGVTVNVVAPGPIRTELFETHNPLDSAPVKKLIEAMPVGRIGEPAEVAAAVGYFLSREAGFTTGQVLYVCGGLSIGAVPN